MRNDGLGEAAVLACSIVLMVGMMMFFARCSHEEWFRTLGDAVLRGMQ